MRKLNYQRLAIGAIAGTVAWSLWTSLVTMKVLLPAYAAEQKLGHVFSTPRYGMGLFFSSWLLVILAVTAVAAWFYARFYIEFASRLRATAVIGGLFGFLVSVPINLSVTSWSTMTASIPLGWFLDAWVGVLLATSVVALMYRESK